MMERRVNVNGMGRLHGSTWTEGHLNKTCKSSKDQKSISTIDLISVYRCREMRGLHTSEGPETVTQVILGMQYSLTAGMMYT